MEKPYIIPKYKSDKELEDLRNIYEEKLFNACLFTIRLSLCNLTISYLLPVWCRELICNYYGRKAFKINHKILYQIEIIFEGLIA